MEKWEYCWVHQIKGAAWLYYLQDSGIGIQIEKVEEKNVANGAKLIARLGKEGWEAVSCSGVLAIGRAGNMAVVPDDAVWYLKRRIP